MGRMKLWIHVKREYIHIHKLMTSWIDGFKRLARECQLRVGVNKVVVANGRGFGYE